MIVVTGAAGFIGSNIIEGLNEENIKDIIAVDKLDSSDKWKNLAGINFRDYIDAGSLIGSLDYIRPDIIIHMGACASTTEKDSDYLMRNNFEYSRNLFDWCVKHNKRIIYASSAATYGGNANFIESTLQKPLNMYGYSKLLMDRYASESAVKPKQWAGLRFFNVYGPNEYHKGKMASVMLNFFQEIKSKGTCAVFASGNPNIADGESKRDFIYVKDIVKVVKWFCFNKTNLNGIFNVGTGLARSHNDVAKIIFGVLDIPEHIYYIQMPEILKGHYQYFTQADMRKLRSAGYSEEFYTLEEGIKDYIENYLNVKN
jgi:ADP-L-glycero-D-manno-heptose 6-epimerase